MHKPYWKAASYCVYSGQTGHDRADCWGAGGCGWGAGHGEVLELRTEAKPRVADHHQSRSWAKTSVNLAWEPAVGQSWDFVLSCSSCSAAGLDRRTGLSADSFHDAADHHRERGKKNFSRLINREKKY